MDVAELSQRITALLAPLIAGLYAPDGPASQQSGPPTGEDIGHPAASLWQRLGPALAAKPSALEALEDLAGNPDDPDTQAAFRQQLKKILGQDAELASALSQFSMGAQSPGTYTAAAHEQGVIAQDGAVAAHEIAVGRDVNGHIIVILICVFQTKVDINSTANWTLIP